MNQTIKKPASMQKAENQLTVQIGLERSVEYILTDIAKGDIDKAKEIINYLLDKTKEFNGELFNKTIAIKQL